MTPQELTKMCADAINFHTQNNLPMEDARVTLVLKKGWKAPPKFPRRELLCVNPRDERVYAVSAANLLAWLVGNGLAGVNIIVKKDEKTNDDHTGDRAESS